MIERQIEVLELRLTRRQIEVLRLLPNHSRKEIARELGVKLGTINWWLSNHPDGIYGKLRVDNRVQAVMEGIRLEIIDLESIEFPEMERFPWE